MYEHRGYYDYANTLLTHGQDKDDHCMMVYLCPIKDSGSGFYDSNQRM